VPSFLRGAQFFLLPNSAVARGSEIVIQAQTDLRNSGRDRVKFFVAVEVGARDGGFRKSLPSKVTDKERAAFEAVFSEIDRDGSGTIDKQEFVDFFLSGKASAAWRAQLAWQRLRQSDWQLLHKALATTKEGRGPVEDHQDEDEMQAYEAERTARDRWSHSETLASELALRARAGSPDPREPEWQQHPAAAADVLLPREEHQLLGPAKFGLAAGSSVVVEGVRGYDGRSTRVLAYDVELQRYRVEVSPLTPGDAAEQLLLPPTQLKLTSGPGDLERGGKELPWVAASQELLLDWVQDVVVGDPHSGSPRRARRAGRDLNLLDVKIETAEVRRLLEALHEPPCRSLGDKKLSIVPTLDADRHVDSDAPLKQLIRTYRAGYRGGPEGDQMLALTLDADVRYRAVHSISVVHHGSHGAEPRLEAFHQRLQDSAKVFRHTMLPHREADLDLAESNGVDAQTESDEQLNITTQTELPAPQNSQASPRAGTVDPAQTRWLRSIFDQFDQDQDGHVQVSEVAQALRSDPRMTKLFEVSERDAHSADDAAQRLQQTQRFSMRTRQVFRSLCAAAVESRGIDAFLEFQQSQAKVVEPVVGSKADSTMIRALQKIPIAELEGTSHKFSFVAVVAGGGATMLRVSTGTDKGSRMADHSVMPPDMRLGDLVTFYQTGSSVDNKRFEVQLREDDHTFVVKATDGRLKPAPSPSNYYYTGYYVLHKRQAHAELKRAFGDNTDALKVLAFEAAQHACAKELSSYAHCGTHVLASVVRIEREMALRCIIDDAVELESDMVVTLVETGTPVDGLSFSSYIDEQHLIVSAKYANTTQSPVLETQVLRATFATLHEQGSKLHCILHSGEVFRTLSAFRTLQAARAFVESRPLTLHAGAVTAGMTINFRELVHFFSSGWATLGMRGRLAWQKLRGKFGTEPSSRLLAVARDARAQQLERARQFRLASTAYTTVHIATVAAMLHVHRQTRAHAALDSPPPVIVARDLIRGFTLAEDPLDRERFIQSVLQPLRRLQQHGWFEPRVLAQLGRARLAEAEEALEEAEVAEDDRADDLEDAMDEVDEHHQDVARMNSTIEALEERLKLLEGPMDALLDATHGTELHLGRVAAADSSWCGAAAARGPRERAEVVAGACAWARTSVPLP
jgi:Ca2+-binding EF-hand superfamily protein